ncbi:MAG: hypothetical protein ISR76_03820 [Planctomycetes bacterium]|nr:hypothetical protein [Planctomycetota bacterium]MBL7008100.1 hypothetical protein [Planctomycetota bacterium]
MHLLTLRFQADPPEALAGAVCRLQLDSAFDFETVGASRAGLDQRLERLEEPVGEGERQPAWADAWTAGESWEASLGLNNACRFRIPAGQVWPVLSLGEERLELAPFLMPAENHLEVLELGVARQLEVRVLAAGEAVHPCQVEVWGGNGIDEARLLLEGRTSEDAVWRPRLLFGQVDHLRITPEQAWLQQVFGPFPVGPDEVERVIRLPVGLVELVLPAGDSGPAVIKRLPAPGSLIPPGRPEEIPLRDLAPGRATLLTVGPCDLFLDCPAEFFRFEGDARIRAGRHHRLVVRPVPVGYLKLEIAGFDRLVSPAGLEWERPEDGIPPRILLAGSDLPAGIAFLRTVQFAVGEYGCRIRGPLLFLGSNPPEYAIPLEKSWEAEFAVTEGGVHTIRFDWDGGTELVPVVGGQR